MDQHFKEKLQQRIKNLKSNLQKLEQEKKGQEYDKQKKTDEKIKYKLEEIQRTKIILELTIDTLLQRGQEAIVGKVTSLEFDSESPSVWVKWEDRENSEIVDRLDNLWILNANQEIERAAKFPNFRIGDRVEKKGLKGKIIAFQPSKGIDAWIEWDRGMKSLQGLSVLSHLKESKPSKKKTKKNSSISNSSTKVDESQTKAIVRIEEENEKIIDLKAINNNHFPEKINSISHQIDSNSSNNTEPNEDETNFNNLNIHYYNTQKDKQETNICSENLTQIKGNRKNVLFIDNLDNFSLFKVLNIDDKLSFEIWDKNPKVPENNGFILGFFPSMENIVEEAQHKLAIYNDLVKNRSFFCVYSQFKTVQGEEILFQVFQDEDKTQFDSIWYNVDYQMVGITSTLDSTYLQAMETIENYISWKNGNNSSFSIPLNTYFEETSSRGSIFGVDYELNSTKRGNYELYVPGNIYPDSLEANVLEPVDAEFEAQIKIMADLAINKALEMEKSRRESMTIKDFKREIGKVIPYFPINIKNMRKWLKLDGNEDLCVQVTEKTGKLFWKQLYFALRRAQNLE